MVHIQQEKQQHNSPKYNEYFPIPLHKFAIFTLFYVCAPHHPYYFDRNGNPNPVSKYYNYEGENTDSYLGELEFLNKELSPALILS